VSAEKEGCKWTCAERRNINRIERSRFALLLAPRLQKCKAGTAYIAVCPYAAVGYGKDCLDEKKLLSSYCAPTFEKTTVKVKKITLVIFSFVCRL